MISSGSTFSQPPYGWEPQIIGVLSLSGFVGSVASYLAAGRLIDYVSNHLTKPGTERRPEYRLPPIIIPAVIGPMGLIVFGECVAHKTTWVGPAFGYGMQSFGLTAVSNIAITYAVDNYKSVSISNGNLSMLIIVSAGGRSSGCRLHHPRYNRSDLLAVFSELAA